MARRMEWRGAGVDARVVFGMGQCHGDGACTVRANTGQCHAITAANDSYQISLQRFLPNLTTVRLYRTKSISIASDSYQIVTIASDSY